MFEWVERMSDPITEAPPSKRRGSVGKYSRERTVDRSFSIRAHLSRTLGIAAAILALGVWLAAAVPAWHWLAVPGFWVVANFFEWAIHRYPMHRPLQPRMLYRNHALVHHNGFAGKNQEIADVTELSVVMMPWYTIILIFVLASPVAAVAMLIGGRGLAGVFLVAAVSYFLLYELIHTLHHLPMPWLKRYRLASLGWLTHLRAHHHHHHRLERMAHTNFNVTAPLADWALGTYYADSKSD